MTSVLRIWILTILICLNNVIVITSSVMSCVFNFTKYFNNSTLIFISRESYRVDWPLHYITVVKWQKTVFESFFKATDTANCAKEKMSQQADLPKERYIPNGLKFAFGGLAGYLHVLQSFLETKPHSAIF